MATSLVFCKLQFAGVPSGRPIRVHRTSSADSEDGDMRKWRRTRRLNPYQPSADTGLLKILALVVAVVLIVFSGALDCRFAIIPLGIC